MNYIGTQNFETKRCFLRRIKLSDYTMMYENWAKYDEVSRYYPFNPVDDIEIYRDKVKHVICVIHAICCLPDFGIKAL